MELQAWQILQREHFDLVVTDNQMPLLSGVQLIQHIQKQFPQLPIIKVTGSVRNPNDPPPSIPTFYKPFDLSDLSREVSRLLDLST
jgi:CheY-like chemotaxis protein